MAELTTLRRSPLDGMRDRMEEGTRLAAGSVRLSERPFLTMVGLRVDPVSGAARRIAADLGAPLPERCGETATAGWRSTLWLGPDEWLVVSADDADLLLCDLLGAALGSDPGQVVDLSANRTVIELAGPMARAVLEKGCPADLHPRSFGPGRAITTTLARVPLVLWQTREDTYRLLPRGSFAEYVATWLLDAMTEFRPEQNMPT